MLLALEHDVELLHAKVRLGELRRQALALGAHSLGVASLLIERGLRLGEAPQHIDRLVLRSLPLLGLHRRRVVRLFELLVEAARLLLLGRLHRTEPLAQLLRVPALRRVASPLTVGQVGQPACGAHTPAARRAQLGEPLRLRLPLGLELTHLALQRGGGLTLAHELLL